MPVALELDDDVDEVGASRLPLQLRGILKAKARRQKLLRGSRSLAQQLAAYKRARMSQIGRAIERARGNDLMFGLDSGAAGIGASTTANLATSPQKRNIPKRLIVSENIASNFVLSGAFVGVEPILATTSNISMAAFVQDSNIPAFRSVINEVGMDFSLTVTNIGGATQRFVATVIGTYVPYHGFAHY